MKIERKRPFTTEQFRAIYSQVPRLCVDLIIKNKDGVLLALRESDGYINQWHLLGGTVLYRDSISATVDRIAQEELGCEIKVLKQLGYLEYFSELENRGYGYSVSLVFLCEISDENANKIKNPKLNFFKQLPDKTIVEVREYFKENHIL